MTEPLIEPMRIEADTCAGMVLEAIPALMRLLHSAHRQQLDGDDEMPNLGQVRMLKMLRERPWNLSDMASRHHVANSTMSRGVDILVKRGWVERQPAAHDRRQIVLELTAAGQYIHDLIAARTHATVVEMVERLTQEERAQLYAGLAVLLRMSHVEAECLMERPT